VTETPAPAPTAATIAEWLNDFAAYMGLGTIAGIIFALCFLVPWGRL
jgi:hypothetical protein